MKNITTISLIALVWKLSAFHAFSQTTAPISYTDSTMADSVSNINMEEVTIYGSRIPVHLKLSSSAVTVVTGDIKTQLYRSIAADEALRLVPGVRIDNQANGSRIHMSVRGQGLLSERGLRGIKVLIDNIPVNDPTGFTPDLYDVDWETIGNMEVVRGSSTALYGGSSSAGVLNITTENGINKPVTGKFFTSAGSNGFYKFLGQLSGTGKNINYRVTGSEMGGNGYREHTGFRGRNISEKIKWVPSDKLQVQQILMITKYFNQNAEGLSLDQVNENPLQANPDAVPFNEYQRTDRFTAGISGKYSFSAKSDLEFSGYMHLSKYKETSNKAAQYRYFNSPGGMLQYNMHLGKGRIMNNIAFGIEYQSQVINEYKFLSLMDSLRIDKINEANLEDTVMLANQTIEQSGTGAYLSDQLQINDRFNITGSIRFDHSYTKLDDKLPTSYNLSGSKSFDNLTGKIGLAYSVAKPATIYLSWSQGFIPPATEELVNNPLSNSGLNDNLKPATSSGLDAGVRGETGKRSFYDICLFYISTKNDFYRFKLTPARGNQEVFYGNAGNSNRMGLEGFLKYKPIDKLSLTIAYTYSDFSYISPDSLRGIRLPNSPAHQLAADLEFQFNRHFLAGITSSVQSKWSIYTDAIHKDVIQDGFKLFDARLNYKFGLLGVDWAFGFFAKNLLNEKYTAFTEPDPDGNCYQPGSGREYFITLNLIF